MDKNCGKIETVIVKLRRKLRRKPKHTTAAALDAYCNAKYEALRKIAEMNRHS